MDLKFTKEFYKLFDYGTLGPDSRASFERMLVRLEDERAKLQAPFEEFKEINLGLSKMKTARASLSETVLVFPSIQGSGELLLPKDFEADSRLIEQFYADYIQMLHMNDLYLHIFTRALKKGFDLLDNK